VEKHFISIWFFIGSLLTVYGVLILGTGIYELLGHSSPVVVLSRLHLNIWWGAGILLLGLVYVIGCWPKGRSNA